MMAFEDGLGEVTSVCFSGDGEHVLTAGSEGLIAWSIPDGRAAVLDETPCAFVIAERGSTRALTLDNEGTLRVVDPGAGEVREHVLDLEPLEDALAEGWPALALTGDGQLLCSGEEGLAVYELASLDEEEPVARHALDGVYAVSTSGNAAAVLAGEGELHLVRGPEIQEIASGVSAAALHPGGRWLAYAAGHKITVTTPAGALVEELQLTGGHAVTALAFDEDDALLIIDATYGVFRWREGKGLDALPVASVRHDGFGAPIVSPRGDHLAFWDHYFGRVDVHDVEQEESVVSLGRFTFGEDSGSERVWTSPDGRVAVFHAGIGDGQNSNDDLFLFDLEEQRVITRFVEAELFTPFVIGDEIIAALGGEDDFELVVWDHAGREIARVWLELDEGPDDTGMGARGREVFLADPGGGGYVVEVDTKVVRRVDAPPEWAREGTRLYD